MKKWIPNLITMLNLLSGCIAAVYAFKDELILAGIFVALGIFFDFFDGLAARLLKVSSELGTQLDSLADMVTSGVVPGIVMCQLLADATGHSSTLFAVNGDLGWSSATSLFKEITFLGFLITAASGYRLAKFNIDTRQTDSFIGVPTPANAILIISLGIIAQMTTSDFIFGLLSNPYVLILITIISCYLLNAELPLFALKFKTFGWKSNEIRWIFIAICIAMIVILKIYAVPCIIVLYVLMSVFNNLSAVKS
ncbi:CDP-alcohol phosphatidyltransferase family protein [Nonlabens ulvanivorans]|uniref:CDP-diacylglycerol-serine O-phosphatidyltransferase n=4 Tax=Nonlabens ulvanivorans TaxID=906888 RepID=A0A084JXQ5_NONUL|nr:CDP-alcohol phosphatidyltransferase family protein [Nonlabens ulvanivorans]KEZ93739.1 phosphatidylserine synthase [Nonlabens ulvanivorans]GAL75006.1 CDP-diacylglycerol-serine O-phosphatidyltransferase [Nonlabens ulvanivorans]